MYYFRNARKVKQERVSVSEYSIILLKSNSTPLVGKAIGETFKTTVITSSTELRDLNLDNYALLVIDSTFIDDGDIQKALVAATTLSGSAKKLPIMLHSPTRDVEQKLKWYDQGVDDVLEEGLTDQEVVLRCQKLIYNQIAMQQLAQRLDAATNTARIALNDNGALGANLQFLLALNDCGDLDQLGQMYFAGISRYGLSCSLQMRSLMEIKNMEPSGMARHLESQLLTQLKDNGRFIDFGRRTIINYDRVSILIKNMPIEEPEKYGAIKDNIFSLLQGLNARVLSLEDQFKLQQDKASLEKLTRDIYSAMDVIHYSYQEVMKKIALNVENTVEEILYKLPVLSLSEHDEEFFENLSSRAIAETNSIFNDGLKINECVEKIEALLGLAIKETEQEKIHSLSAGNTTGNAVDPNIVELF